MVYTVTLNPALDYLLNISGFQSGKLNRSDNEMLFPGGKGINVSIMLNRLGVSTTALGFIAGKTGSMFADMLKDMKLDSDLINVEKGRTRINVKIKSEQETEINANGPQIEQKDIDLLFQKLDTLNKEDILILAGNVPKTIDQTIYSKILKNMRAKDVACLVDATGDCLTSALEYGPFLVKPNHHELGEIFHTEIKDSDSARKYAIELQKLGARNVLVSRAEEGALLLTETGEFYEGRAPKGKVLNSVGAGDSMVAGFTAGYLQTGSLEEALRLGLAAGSATAFSEMIADREKVLQLRSRVCIL